MTVRMHSRRPGGLALGVRLSKRSSRCISTPARWERWGAQLISANNSGHWGSWATLAPSNSYIRTDNVGFHLVFLDPNYAFVVTADPRVSAGMRAYMTIDHPPEPPAAIEQPDKPSTAPIADERDAFARKTPQTEEDRTQARAFIDGKIEMIRRDQAHDGCAEGYGNRRPRSPATLSRRRGWLVSLCAKRVARQLGRVGSRQAPPDPTNIYKTKPH